MKPLISLLAVVAIIGCVACGIEDQEGDNDLLDGILADPDGDDEVTDDDLEIDEEVPFSEGPTELPFLDE